MRRLLIIIAILSVIGVAVSAYGLWQHYAPLGAAFCNITETFSCDIVNKSAYSEIAGVPVALIGVMGYAALGILAVVIAFRKRPDCEIHQLINSSTRLLLVLSLFGLAFQGALTVIELWWIGAYCLICIASQAIILSIVVLTLIVYRKGSHSLGRSSQTVTTPSSMDQPIIGTLTCPQCGAKQQAEIPTGTCQHSYVCSACGKTITAQSLDCCVFCTYGDRKCPIASSAPGG